MTNPFTIVRSIIVSLALVAWLAVALPAYAGGPVGDGSSESCTESALITALSGGGSVTFNCGAGSVSITLSSQKVITQDTTIDGDGLITLDANHNSSIFHVNAGQALTLTDITLSNGHSSGDGGCIDVDNGSLLLTNVIVENCAANAGYNGGGVNDVNGVVTIYNSTFRADTADSGGAIHITGTLATLNITDSTLNGNSGGGLVVEGSMVTLTNSTLNGNLGDGISNVHFGQVTLINSTLGGNSGGIYNYLGDVTLIDSTVSGNSVSGGIYNDSGGVTLINSAIIGNVSVGDGGGIYNDFFGRVSLNNSIIDHNLATFIGGGIANLNGILIVNHSTISRNTAPYGGGGIFNSLWVTLTDSILSSNSAPDGDGGGIVNTGRVILTDITLSDNSAERGGGLFTGEFGGRATLMNSTVSANSAITGGGLYNLSGTLMLTNVTVSGNFATTGGGVVQSSAGSISLTNSILAYSPMGSNCFINGYKFSQHSISSDSTCALTGIGNLNNADPLITGLGNYGGPTEVHMLKLGSPAIDTGSNADCPSADQRGKPRPVNGTCDVGAVERQPTDSDLAPRLYLPLLER